MKKVVLPVFLIYLLLIFKVSAQFNTLEDIEDLKIEKISTYRQYIKTKEYLEQLKITKYGIKDLLYNAQKRQRREWEEMLEEIDKKMKKCGSEIQVYEQTHKDKGFYSFTYTNYIKNIDPDIYDIYALVNKWQEKKILPNLNLLKTIYFTDDLTYKLFKKENVPEIKNIIHDRDEFNGKGIYIKNKKSKKPLFLLYNYCFLIEKKQIISIFTLKQTDIFQNSIQTNFYPNIQQQLFSSFKNLLQK
ncbi:MAG TPA: hypothetical protein VKS21_06715 [Spirochaetota bacterium]|nr:hypothetical protein [Spirochaetota bacterium]